MAEIILVSGGIKSGKSNFSISLAKKIGKNVLYIATCIPEDEEMRKRVMEHRKERPKEWLTVVEVEDPEWIFLKYKKMDVIIMDCLGMLVTNWLIKGKSIEWMYEKIEALCNMARESGFSWIVVTNEVGQCVVPQNELARAFIDILGRLNQILAQYCDRAYLVFFGKELRIK